MTVPQNSCLARRRHGAGMQVVHYLELKQYNWVGLRDIPRLRDKVKRVASQVSQVLTKK